MLGTHVLRLVLVSVAKAKNSCCVVWAEASAHSAHKKAKLEIEASELVCRKFLCVGEYYHTYYPEGITNWAHNLLGAWKNRGFLENLGIFDGR